MGSSQLYKGIWGDLKLLFCPANIAGITVDQNRHQFEIIVSDIHKFMDLCSKYGGELIGSISEDEEALKIGIYDPDGNSLTFSQIKVHES